MILAKFCLLCDFTSMITQVMLNREKWISALMLDPETGLDPPGIKLRAAQGIDAASSFIQGVSYHSTLEAYD